MLVNCSGLDAESFGDRRRGQAFGGEFETRLLARSQVGQDGV